MPEKAGEGPPPRAPPWVRRAHTEAPLWGLGVGEPLRGRDAEASFASQDATALLPSGQP